MPKYINKLLQSCYKSPCGLDPDWFMVHSDKLNNYLTKRFGIYTDTPTFNYGTYKVRFNWRSQTWIIQ